MAEAEKVILTTMCMVYDNEGRILVQDRADKGWSGIAFPGGHVEAGESFTDSIVREVWEETGLTIHNPVLCGLKHFWNDKGERYVVFLYRTNEFSGELRSSEEGNVFWIRRDEIENYRLARSFMQMLKVMECGSPKELYYSQNGSGWERK